MCAKERYITTRFGLQHIIGKVLRPFHCVQVKCSKFEAGSINFTFKLAIADVEKRLNNI